jgi:endonuclease/exonuclease/phosphatase (EEP) superfamily protein YafD
MFVLLAAALALHVTVRDRYPLVATFFYATPLPLIIAGAAIFALAALLTRRMQWFTAFSMLAIVAAYLWISAWPRHEQKNGELRVITWNARRSHSAASAAFLRSLDPDIAAVVEIPVSDPSVVATWRELFRGYSIRPLQGGSMLLAKGTISKPQRFEFGRRSRTNALRVSLHDREINVLAVDLDANPFHGRANDFKTLGNIVDTYASPRIILGDFNTPGESIFFDELRRRGLRDAFEAGGRGAPETWPWPLPVLTLDHIWLSPELTPMSCRKVRTRRSDHLAVVTDISFREKRPR